MSIHLFIASISSNSGLYGIDASTLSANNFLFDVTPHTLNTGIIDIDTGATMPFYGTIENNGTIHNAGTLIIDGDLTGTGTVEMSGLSLLEIGGIFNQDINLDVNASATLKFDADANLTGLVHGFDANDTLDLRDLLTGAGVTTDTASQYLSLSEADGNTTLSIDHDGMGPDGSIAVVTLAGVTNTLLSDLIANNEVLI